MPLHFQSPLPSPIRKLSYRELAARTGISHMTLYAQISGRAPVTIRTVDALVASYALDFARLVTYSPPAPTDPLAADSAPPPPTPPAPTQPATAHTPTTPAPTDPLERYAALIAAGDPARALQAVAGRLKRSTDPVKLLARVTADPTTDLAPYLRRRGDKG